MKPVKLTPEQFEKVSRRGIFTGFKAVSNYAEYQRRYEERLHKYNQQPTITLAELDALIASNLLKETLE